MAGNNTAEAQEPIKKQRRIKLPLKHLQSAERQQER